MRCRIRALALTPYLIVRDARAAIAWYGDVFGARLVGDAYVDDDDRIGHAELDVDGVPLYLADEYPELGLSGPGDGSPAVSLHLRRGDVDAVVGRAVECGASVERPPADTPHGRTGVVVDPYGHRWILQAPDGAATPGTRGTPCTSRSRCPTAPGPATSTRPSWAGRSRPGGWRTGGRRGASPR